MVVFASLIFTRLSLKTICICIAGVVAIIFGILFLKTYNPGSFVLAVQEDFI